MLKHKDSLLLQKRWNSIKRVGREEYFASSLKRNLRLIQGINMVFEYFVLILSGIYPAPESSSGSEASASDSSEDD